MSGMCKMYKDMMDNNVRFKADLLNHMIKYPGVTDEERKHLLSLVKQADKNIEGYFKLYKQCENK